MKYVSVTSPGSDMAKPIFKYFDNYLISLGEPITGEKWKDHMLVYHMDKILKECPSDAELYIDSGGFQIIVGYVKNINRIKEFVDIYHYLLLKNKDKIKNIFTLDIFSESFMKDFVNINETINGEKVLKKIPIFPKGYEVYSPDQLSIEKTNDAFYYSNKYSMEKSISLIKDHSEISDKQLFVMQSSNIITFKIWKQLFNELEVYNYYKRWSIGGLVGLKKSTNAKFSHAVPATLWLLTYQKKLNFKIEQVHWLGQSSKLSFLSMRLFERLYNLNMTSDSSQLVRFAPLEAKLPYLIKDDNDFRLISNKDDVEKFMFPKLSYSEKHIIRIGEDGYIDNRFNDESIRLQKELNPHAVTLLSISDIQCDEIDGKLRISPRGNVMFIECTALEYFQFFGRLHNKTFIDLQSQNLFADLEFGNFIIDKIIDNGTIDDILEVSDLKKLHPVMERGRVAQELFNNIQIFKQFDNIVKLGDTDAADKIMEDTINIYMEREENRLLTLQK